MSSPNTEQAAKFPQIENTRVKSVSRLIPPTTIKKQFPISPISAKTVYEGRNGVERILLGEDPRLLIVIGPCSIHDPEAALNYARRLLALREEVQKHLFIIMRVYFEKPRTTTGWKGLINDPDLDESCDVAKGLVIARNLLRRITEMGLPAATEFLDPIVPQFIGDLISWAAIGARTTESQTHREMASGLSMPVGFKNGTDGNVQTAIDAMRAARTPHSFLGIDQEGNTSVIKTTGNTSCHLVLRGGRQGTNYHTEFLTNTVETLRAVKLPPVLMIDCSHANANKEHNRQVEVWENILDQRRQKHCPIVGAMLESFLEEGNQPFSADRAKLKHGISITDPCINWTTTETILRAAAR